MEIKEQSMREERDELGAEATLMACLHQSNNTCYDVQ